MFPVLILFKDNEDLRSKGLLTWSLVDITAAAEINVSIKRKPTFFTITIKLCTHSPFQCVVVVLLLCVMSLFVFTYMFSLLFFVC